MGARRHGRGPDRFGRNLLRAGRGRGPYPRRDCPLPAWAGPLADRSTPGAPARLSRVRRFQRRDAGAFRHRHCVVGSVGPGDAPAPLPAPGRGRPGEYPRLQYLRRLSLRSQSSDPGDGEFWSRRYRGPVRGPGRFPEPRGRVGPEPLGDGDHRHERSGPSTTPQRPRRVSISPPQISTRPWAPSRRSDAPWGPEWT